MSSVESIDRESISRRLYRFSTRSKFFFWCLHFAQKHRQQQTGVNKSRVPFRLSLDVVVCVFCQSIFCQNGAERSGKCTLAMHAKQHRAGLACSPEKTAQRKAPHRHQHEHCLNVNCAPRVIRKIILRLTIRMLLLKLLNEGLCVINIRDDKIKV